MEILTRRRELVGKVFEQFFSGKVSHRAEQNDRPDEARVSQHDALVRGKLADAVGEHDVVPVILRKPKKATF